MRIVSLVPSATEICAALGLTDSLVGITHECDHPPEITGLPQLTRSVIPEGLDSAGIDAAVKERTLEGLSLYELDEELLASLEPDLILTQAVCEVCAVSYEDVVSIAARLPTGPRVLSLDPSTLEDVIADCGVVAEAAGAPENGERLKAELRARIGAVESAVAGRDRPGVIALEWLDPVFLGGHWVPEMIALAGGSDMLAQPGEKSREIPREQLVAEAPDVAVVMPCGLYRDEAVAEAGRHQGLLGDLGPGRCFAVDAASSFSRPGPRLADGVELLGHLIHPELVPAPAGLGFAQVDLPASSSASR